MSRHRCFKPLFLIILPLAALDADSSPVPNDRCVDAIPLQIPAIVMGSTVGAAGERQYDIEECGGHRNDYSGAGVWYTVVGNGNRLKVSTCNPGTDLDTTISVFCSPTGNGARVTCVGRRATLLLSLI